MSRRSFDLVVYGASGFTGSLVAEYISKAAIASDLKWAVAGRNEDKLRKVLSEIDAEVPIIQADASNPESLKRMTKDTHVVVSTVGPFLQYGAPLIDACVSSATHYVDISGEYFWVRDMIEKYDAAAKEKGVILVPMCGYDSVPGELTTVKAVRYIREHMNCGTKRVISIYESNGGVSGGTIASALNCLGSPALKRAESPNCLHPIMITASNKKQAAAAAAKITAPVSDMYMTLPHRLTGSAGRFWTCPWMLGPSNARAVRRSAALFAGNGSPYAHVPFDYQEYEKASGLFDSIKSSISAIVGEKLLSFSWVRSLARRWVPKPGQGPSKEKRDRSYFKVTAMAEPEKPEFRGQKVYVTMAGGDPGYSETSKFVAECGMALTPQRFAKLPERARRGGFLTPAFAFGDFLPERLQETGNKFEITTTPSKLQAVRKGQRALLDLCIASIKQI